MAVFSDVDVDKEEDFGVGDFVAGSSSSKVTFSSEVCGDEEGDFDVGDFVEGSSSSKVVFPFDRNECTGGDGMMLRSGG